MTRLGIFLFAAAIFLASAPSAMADSNAWVQVTTTSNTAPNDQKYVLTANDPVTDSACLTSGHRVDWDTRYKSPSDGSSPYATIIVVSGPTTRFS